MIGTVVALVGVGLVGTFFYSNYRLEQKKRALLWGFAESHGLKIRDGVRGSMRFRADGARNGIDYELSVWPTQLTPAGGGHKSGTRRVETTVTARSTVERGSVLLARPYVATDIHDPIRGTSPFTPSVELAGFQATASDPEAAAAWLTPDRLARFGALPDVRELRVHEGAVSIACQGMPRDAEMLDALVGLVVELCRT